MFELAVHNRSELRDSIVNAHIEKTLNKTINKSIKLVY